jgi:ketosteroid isomerase-like protein
VSRNPNEVVGHHLDAVRSGDADAMASDYAEHAVIERPDATYRGRPAIREYFRSVPDRLGDGTVVFDDVDTGLDGTVVTWHIEGGPGDGTRGHDTLVVDDGAIVHQRVKLAGPDF